MAMPLPPLTIVRSSTHVEIEWMRLPAAEIEFTSAAEEEAYASKDCGLAELIERAVIKAANDLPQEQVVFTSHDWWPNRNRAVTVSKRAFSKALLQALVSLITAEYKDWRINVRVVNELPDETSDLGVLFLTSEKLVVEQSLWALLENAA